MSARPSGRAKRLGRPDHRSALGQERRLDRLRRNHGDRRIESGVHYHWDRLPSTKYRHVLKPWEKLFVGNGLNVDEAYVRGVRAIDAGVLDGMSDHKGIWVDISSA